MLLVTSKGLIRSESIAEAANGGNKTKVMNKLGCFSSGRE